MKIKTRKCREKSIIKKKNNNNNKSQLDDMGMRYSCSKKCSFQTRRKAGADIEKFLLQNLTYRRLSWDIQGLLPGSKELRSQKHVSTMWLLQSSAVK